MDRFMVLCTFEEGTVTSEVFAVAAEERARVAALAAEGRIGSLDVGAP